MCLAIPGRVVQIVDDVNQLAQVDVAGVRRTVNVGLLDAPDLASLIGSWVLIHVGFALSQIDEARGAGHAGAAAADGRRLRAGADRAAGEHDRMSAPTRPAAGPGAPSPRRCDVRATCADSPDARAQRGSDRGARACAVDEAGRQLTVDTGILGDVAPGEALLVHAGAALARVRGEGA